MSAEQWDVAELVEPNPDYERNRAYAKAGPYRTQLSSEDERGYQAWVKQNNVPTDDSESSDYDMRGFYRGMRTGDEHAQTGVNQNDGKLHFSDYYKTPYHKSFSRESQWATDGAPSWNDQDQLVDPKGTVVFDERASQASDNWDVETLTEPGDLGKGGHGSVGQRPRTAAPPMAGAPGEDAYSERASAVGRQMATGQDETGESSWGEVAGQLPGALGTQYAKRESGAREAIADEVRLQARKELWQAIVLPSAVRRARDAGMNLTEDPDVVANANRLGIRPDTFVRDWPSVVNLSDEQLLARQKSARDRYEGATEDALEQRRISQQANEMSAAYAPNMQPWSAKSIVFDAMQSVPDMLAGIGAGVVATPAAGVAVLGASVAPGFYSDARDMGIDPHRAQIYTALMTGAEVAPELPVFEALLENPAGKAAIKQTVAAMILKQTGKVAETAAFEGVSESVTEALQIGIEEGLIDKDTPLPQALERIARAGVVGAAMGAGVAGVHQGLSGTVESAMRRGNPRSGPLPNRIEPTLEDVPQTAVQGNAPVITQEPTVDGGPPITQPDADVSDGAVLPEAATPAGAWDVAELVEPGQPNPEAEYEWLQNQPKTGEEAAPVAEAAPATAPVPAAAPAEPPVEGQKVDTGKNSPTPEVTQPVEPIAPAAPSGPVAGESGKNSPPSNEEGKWDITHSTSPIEEAAHAAATSPHNDLPEPTAAQKEAGNYTKGHVRLHGFDITIENPAGSVRRSLPDAQTPWEVTMPHHYGYIRRTIGADEEQVDVTLGSHAEDASKAVYVLDQNRPGTERFDEHKVFMGFDSAEEVMQAYRGSFAGDFGKKMARGLKPRQFTLDEFDDWLDKGDLKKPVADWPRHEVDENGVRSVVQNGIRVTEPVELIPTRAGIRTVPQRGATTPVSNTDVAKTANAESTTSVPAPPEKTVKTPISRVPEQKPSAIREQQTGIPDELNVASWWKNELTEVGRQAVIQAAGIKVPKRMAWTYLTPEERGKLAAVHGTDADPGHARKQAEEKEGDEWRERITHEFDITVAGRKVHVKTNPGFGVSRSGEMHVDFHGTAVSPTGFRSHYGTLARDITREELESAVTALGEKFREENLKEYKASPPRTGSSLAAEKSRHQAYARFVLEHGDDADIVAAWKKAEPELREEDEYRDVPPENFLVGWWMAKNGYKPDAINDLRGVGVSGISSRELPYLYGYRAAGGKVGATAETDAPAGAVETPVKAAQSKDRGRKQRTPEGPASEPTDVGGARAPEGTPAAGVREPEGERPVGGDAAPARPDDAERAGRAPGAGDEPGRRVADGAGEVPDAARGGGQHAAGDVGPDTDRGRAPVVPQAVEQRERRAELVPAATPSGNYVITAADKLGEGGQKTKARQNVDAIRLLKDLQKSNTPASREQQEALVKYVGWGGIPQIFDTGKAEWEALRAELSGLLTSEEFAAARRSTQDAHYTSETVVRGMWSALSRMGFNGGAVLEPSVGVGHFFGMMPAEQRTGARMTGVELDPITGGIAKLLYPGDRVHAPMGFQDFAVANDSFDLAIGNPPFGSQTLFDRTRKELNGLSIHNYFFAKSIDAVRPGGLLVMVTSHYFLDAETRAAREYIAQRANLVAAIRLPNTAFKENAGTEVVTDIVILRKRMAGEESNGVEWLDTMAIADPLGGKSIIVNKWLAQRPQDVLGRTERSGKMRFASEMSVTPTGDLAQQLAEAIERLPKDAYTPYRMPDGGIRHDEVLRELSTDISNVKPFGTFQDEHTGDLLRRIPDENGKQRAVVVMPVAESKSIPYQRIVRMVGLKNLILDQLRLEIEDAPKKKLEEHRRELAANYSGFVKKYGYFNDPANKALMREDPEWPILLSVEESYDKGLSATVAKRLGVDPRPRSANAGQILRRRVRFPRKPPTNAATAADALALTLAEVGKVDPAYMERLRGQSAEKIIEELGDEVFLDPSDGWVTRDQFLSGNVKKKLAWAETALAAGDQRQARNVKALREVQPADVPATKIGVRMGAPWVPPEYMSDFAEHLFGKGTQSEFAHLPASGSWSFTLKPGDPIANSTKWGTKRRRGKDLLEAQINNQPIRIYDEHADGTRSFNEEATQEAQAMAARMEDEWLTWVWKDPERRTALVRHYNDKFNTNVRRRYNGRHLTRNPDGTQGTLIGASVAIALRPHQENAVWRVIQDGSGLLDHVVGAGKTFAIVGSVMERRRLGLSRRPMIAVPNHLVGQWAQDFVRLYPGAKVLATTKKDFEKANRQRLFARIATGDWDAVIVAHSSFGFIDMPMEEYRAHIAEMVADLETSIRTVEAVEGKKSRSIKDMEKMKERLTARLQERLEARERDKVVDFEQLGIDMLAVDELHEFKNLGFATSLRNIAGLGDTSGSQKAEDLYVKVRYIQKRNAGRGFVGATGTPWSNTLAEMYTLQRYFQYDRLRELGLTHFDSWQSTFARRKTDWEIGATGSGYKLRERLGSFTNLKQLREMYREFADVVLRRHIDEDRAARGLPPLTPPIRGGKPELVVAERSPAQAAYMDMLVARAEKLKGTNQRQKGADNMLAITGDARKAGLDMRLIYPSAADNPGSKINELVRRALEIYRKWDALRGTQLIFCDLSTPKNARAAEARELRELQARAEAGDEAAEEKLGTYTVEELDALSDSAFDVYNDIKSKLMVGGVPEREIAFIHDYGTDEKKADLFESVRAGRVRFMLASTKKAGAGTNVQTRVVALHHTDAPWKPSELEQREGRVVRQGNAFYEGNPDLEIDPQPGFQLNVLRYATKQTYDAYMWQTIESKANFIEDFRDEGDATEADDIAMQAASAAEMKAASSGNPLIMEEVQLKSDIQQLENLRRAHVGKEHDLQDIVRRAGNWAAVRDKAIAAVEQDLEAREPVPTPKNDDEKAEILKARKARGESIRKTLLDIVKVQKHDLRGLGKYRGFEVFASWNSMAGAPYLEVLGATGGHESSYAKSDTIDPLGIMRRLDNMIDALDDMRQQIEDRSARARAEMESAQAELGKPFPREAEYLQKKVRHAEVLKELTPKKPPAAAKPADITDQPALSLAPGLYSPTLRAIEGLDQVRASGPHWYATIAARPGIKQEELDWLGLKEWLGDRERVTKDELLDFVRANQIHVEEEDLQGGEPEAFENREITRLQEELRAQHWNVDINDDEYFGAELGEITHNGQPVYDDVIALPEFVRTRIRQIERLLAESEPRETGGTIYSQYTLPGATNYHELLLTLPGLVKRFDDSTIDEIQTFENEHWDRRPNVVAHVRFNERVDADGKRTLFLEEVQSDWHQKGRDRGYRPVEGRLPAGYTLKGVGQFWVEGPDGKRVNPYERPSRGEALGEALNIIETGRQQRYEDNVRRGESVPDAPFKTTWPELVMKRMLRWAAENGFERIAWAPGHVHNERFSLERHIREIKYSVDRWEKPYKYDLVVTTHAGKQQKLAGLHIEGVRDYVGAELADRIATGAGTPAGHVADSHGEQREVRALSGLDLKIGGEGNRTFYDAILPSTVGKLIKKWGGKVGTTSIDPDHGQPPDKVWPYAVYVNGVTVQQSPSRAEAETAAATLRARSTVDSASIEVDVFPRHKNLTVHSFDLTPEMTQATLAGLPMFRRVKVIKGEAPRSRVPTAVLKAHFEKIAGSLPGARIHIIEGAKGLPPGRQRDQIQKFDDRLWQGAVLKDRFGHFDIFANAYGIESIADAEKLLWHEATHRGFYGALGGRQYGKLLEYLYNTLGGAPTFQEQINDYFTEAGTPFDVNNPLHRQKAVDEYLARWSEQVNAKGTGIVDSARRVVLAIKAWLDRFMRTHGWRRTVSHAEIIDTLRAMARRGLTTSSPATPGVERVTELAKWAEAQTPATETPSLTPAMSLQPGGNNPPQPSVSTSAPSTLHANPVTATYRAYQAMATNWINLWNKKAGWVYGPLGKLPQQDTYLTERYLTLGRITNAQEIARGIYDSFVTADAQDTQAIYDYMTSAGAMPINIRDQELRRKAVQVKALIDQVGQRLVNTGLLSKEAYMEHEDAYLPRVYLRHMLGDDAFRALGNGKRVSDMGYLKQRKDIPKDVRELILGEITDPAFLASFSLSRTMRDLAIIDFLDRISQEGDWILSGQMVKWRGHNVTPQWLRSEAEHIRRQATHYQPGVAARALALAQQMEQAANKVLNQITPDMKSFRQVPDSIRYGMLRGMWVRKEIFDDLIGAQRFVDPSTIGLAERLLGQGGAVTRVTQWWKFSKVALNPPTQIRNFMTNHVMLHLSGVPAAKVYSGYLLTRALNDLVHNGPYTQIAKRYGLWATSFANTELAEIKREWLNLQARRATTSKPLTYTFAHLKDFAGAILDKVSDVYQFSETITKMQKIIHAMESEGLKENEAVLEAQKWLFDYSLVPRSIAYLRNAPIGVPFATFNYKVLPRLGEVALRHPARLALYAMIPYLLTAWIARMFDVEPDDVDKLKKAVPEWMQEKSGVTILPYKDSLGRWQAFNYGYYVPWTMYADVANKLRAGKPREALDATGVPSGPILDLTAALRTNIDPFTNKEIVNSADPPAEQVAQVFGYVWNLAAPPWAGTKGDVSKVIDAATGKVNPKTGDPQQSLTQAAIRLLGVGVYPVEPEKTRVANLRHMEFEIEELSRRMSEKARDRNLTQAQREKIIDTYRVLIGEHAARMKRYAAESEVAPNLRTK